MNTDSTLIHDETAQRFILPIGDEQAFINYTIKDGILRLNHAETPFVLRGQGIGRKLVEETFDYIESRGMKAISICGFIRSVLHSNDRTWEGIS